MKIYILCCLILLSASKALATSRDEIGEYITRMGQRIYKKRNSVSSSSPAEFSIASLPPTMPVSVVHPVSTIPKSFSKTFTQSSTQTLILEHKSIVTETDIIPTKTIGINAIADSMGVLTQATNTESTSTKNTESQTPIRYITEHATNTAILTMTDQETNTAPFEGHGKHLYNVVDKITQTQPYALSEGGSVKPLMTDSVGLD